MKFLLATVSSRLFSRATPASALIKDYVARCGRYAEVSLRDFPSENGLLASVEEMARRTRPVLALTDSRGRQLSSGELASEIGMLRDAGTQTVILAIGPADGWSAAATKRADLMIAFGRITLPHELAAVVAAEQIYRALTILAGHPYHTGH